MRIIKLLSYKECAIAISNMNEDLSFSNKLNKSKFKHLKCLMHVFSYKINTTNSSLFERNYGVLTFPLHKGIRRHTVSKPCQTQNNNKQILFSFIHNLAINTHTQTLRTKWVPSNTMDVRGANTFLLYNRLPIPCFWS